MESIKRLNESIALDASTELRTRKSGTISADFLWCPALKYVVVSLHSFAGEACQCTRAHKIAELSAQVIRGIRKNGSPARRSK